MNQPASSRLPVSPTAGTERFGAWIGVSEHMRELFSRLRAISKSRQPIVIEGELGVGKQSLLREVHHATSPADRPLVVVGCGSTPAHLAEAELFGGGGGAPGALQRAAGGDLLLSDIALLPLAVQTALAERFSGAGILPRLFATSRQSLEEECRRGRFVKPLFDLVANHRHTLLPLRARRDDIIPLAMHFLALCQSSSDEPVGDFGLSSDQVEALVNHDWPGNARELRNVIERAAKRGREGTPTFPVTLIPPSAGSGGAGWFDPQLSYRETRAKFESDFEMRYVRWLLERHSGNISAASREARMDRKYLYDLARKHGLRGQKSR